MEQSDLLRHACNICESLGLTYLVTGSTATIAYGEPRFTNDIDIVGPVGPEDPGFLCGVPERSILHQRASRQHLRVGGAT